MPTQTEVFQSGMIKVHLFESSENLDMGIVGRIILGSR